MPAVLEPPPKQRCPICQDMDYVCKYCFQPDGACTCTDGPELIRCPECTHAKP